MMRVPKNAALISISDHVTPNAFSRAFLSNCKMDTPILDESGYIQDANAGKE